MPPDENAERRSSEKYWVAKCLEYRSSILRIQCGESMGTGWIAACSPDRDAFLVATANHVTECSLPGPPIDKLVLYADDSSGTEIIVKYSDKGVSGNGATDVAVIRVNAPPPGPELPLLVYDCDVDRKDVLSVKIPPLGIEVGWIGFAETPYQVFHKPTTTFCRGRISAIGELSPGQHRFLLDGNVNKGMSGGPVWDSVGNIIGIVTHIARPESKVGTLHGVIVPMAYVWEGLSKAGACAPGRSPGGVATPASLQFDGNPDSPASQGHRGQP
jgi:hypothetical protein